ncbi:MAG: NADH:ubiquinone reductase (Na(+)-transporting) subunit D [Microscillaceae bacterium]|jgi:Na+-transporting NADH:ubiquinone oxidoreductase subunit D|nr:NADH:ubiquinone reductase (Na(+)-transporting) subunit D [Microscillaceae bacterium]
MAETAEKTAEVKPKDGLLSKKNRKLLIDPLDGNNPITVQVLGICSALAVTVQLEPALFMAAGVTIVTACSNVVISMLRNSIPSRIRIIVQLAIVSLWVILVDQILQAFFYDVSKKLSTYVGLIITNCIVMGRLEAYAMANKPWPSFLDGLGNGFGYGLILVIVAFFRELFGSGSLFGYKVFAAAGIPYMGNGLLMLPAGACIIVGIIIWVQRALNGYSEDH